MSSHLTYYALKIISLWFLAYCIPAMVGITAFVILGNVFLSKCFTVILFTNVIMWGVIGLIAAFKEDRCFSIEDLIASSAHRFVYEDDDP